ncbi:Olfactory Receptor 56A4 [Manis pentadactyla]|nr:Olfactory Receptor 56A4 [Manis pentadactyla]
MGATTTLLIIIRMEASLHQPMHYLLSLLSLLDMVLCLTIIPKDLAIFWFDLRSISFPACFLQMYIMNSFLTMESPHLHAVLRIKAEGAAAKALSTCGSQFLLILFFSTVLLVLVITTCQEEDSPDVPILLNILRHIIPPALNPIVYGAITKGIKQGTQKLLRRF